MHITINTDSDEKIFLFAIKKIKFIDAYNSECDDDT